MERAIEMRLSGSGGQGLILAGIILAEAAILDGKNALQTQSYGPEARGGASKAEVIISQGDIDYPKVTVPDVVLAMTQEASDKYAGSVSSTGLLLLDTTYVHELPQSKAKVCALPISSIARDEVGKEMVANVVALGALVRLTGVVTLESLTKALMRRIPKGTEALNRKALELGWESGMATAACITA
ncbi:MAG: 2-oxoacid:acceptor oxidoreductase family protein [Bacillota bacterium]